MAANARDYRGLYRTTPIPACVISEDELRRLYGELNAKAQEATEKHIAAQRKPADMDDARWAELLQEARIRGVLTTAVFGLDGDQMMTESPEALSEDRLPDKVASVHFDSAAGLQVVNVTPLNRFRLSLDFTTPGLFGAYNLWEDPTPNSSRLEINGTDQTWTRGVHDYVTTFFRNRSKPRGILHTPLTFNVVNWLLGFPIALWIVFRVDTAFAEQFAKWPVALRGALYVYIVLIVLAAFRGMMHALRWTYPRVELRGSRANSKRTLVVGSIGVILLSIAYDIGKAVVNLM